MKFLGTTVLAVKRDGKTVMAGDGQVTLGETIMKATAKKVRKLGNGKVIAGFAGSVADAFTLFDRFESKLRESNGILKRAAVELAKDWRTDRVLRKLEALLMVADANDMFLISGNGEIIEPDEPIMSIGSGGSYAIAAARALYRNTNMSAHDIATKSLEIAGEICIYTNSNITVEEI